MVANANVLSTMTKAAPVFGVTGGVAAMTVVPGPDTKFFAGAVMFALAAASALRQWLAQSEKQPLGDYPFNTRTANPWERDGGPAGL